ncbi:MAG TPA: M43 family zinc metalloprotease [Puia sp.]|nr:M43 family zinc metalloprotease [Puia sp.]
MRHFLCLSVFLLLLLRLPVVAQQGCRSVDYKQDLLRKDPELAARIMEIERFTRQQQQHSSVIVTGTDAANASHNDKAVSTITIPVIVHIVYNNASQNISDAQVQSQIAVLNRDYGKQNPDTSRIPSYYRDLAADCGIRFALANVDTNGGTTTGIVRRQTNQRQFTYDDAVKFTSRGGDDGWDRDRYLNIWVTNLTPGVLGYSSVPGCAKPNDGVVISYTAFGTMGTATAPFNLGRTATHEIGHWLNLIHIWGDADCGDDYVNDTPQQGAATHGNPSGMIFSCGNTPYGNLYMDYMDFTDDAGMHLFTYGQRDRIRALFAPGGFRNALLSSTGLAPGTTIGPINEPSGDGASIRLYPNPATGPVWIISSNASNTGAVLEIFNQVGQKVMTSRIPGPSFQLDISSLPRGLYFIHVNGDSKNSLKLIKM